MAIREKVRRKTQAEERLRKRLRQLRQGANLSLAQLADEANLSPDAVAKIEAGERSPRLNTIASLSTALGVRISDLVDEPGPALPAEVYGLVQALRKQPEEVRSTVLQIARLVVELRDVRGNTPVRTAAPTTAALTGSPGPEGATGGAPLETHLMRG
ncbi:MAG: helix-turn-helix domain-containing protein [Myxococcota bacterium]